MPIGQETWIEAGTGLLILALAALAARWLAAFLLPRAGRLLATAIAAATEAGWTPVLLDQRVLVRLAQVVPWVVVQAGISAVPHLPAAAVATVRNVALALVALYLVRALLALLDAVYEAYGRPGASPGAPGRSFKSYVQLAKLLLMLLGGIVIIAALIDRSPLILLSGVGALSAVLMLVFKDTLLSFTAGLQLSSNDMLRIGDWIEMPQLGADGDVIDIALHTVKVQNWDKTITTIPTWRLMSESFRNWRGMSEYGGRRIKRTLRLDAGSVRFLGPDEIDRLTKIALIRPYLVDRLGDVARTNEDLSQRLGELAAMPANQRRLTNLGTFRAYVDAYLRNHPGINGEMTRMVRAMEPGPEGVPMEIYCFTATTRWVEYEGIQSDIFDHLLAILPEFGLRAFQKPAGSDIGAAFSEARR